MFAVGGWGALNLLLLGVEWSQVNTGWAIQHKSPPNALFLQVGYGSFHFHRQTGGLVAIHSLKNPAAPECLFVTASGE